MKNNELKILTIGNSFSVDTMEHVASIAKNLGINKIKLGNLYVGGCSITQHHCFLAEQKPVYTYYQNDGFGWSVTEGVKSSDALDSEAWDYVTIQPGTGDGSRHTDEKSYEKLLPLLESVKSRIPLDTKVAFNLTWVGEPTCTHHEISSYGGDQLLLLSKIIEMVKTVVCPLKEVDFIIPTGVAIQNARTATKEILTRDNFHLSYDKGRYIAGLTFFSKITGISIDTVTWAPDGVDENFRKIAIKAVNDALKNPFSITKCDIKD